MIDLPTRTVKLRLKSHWQKRLLLLVLNAHGVPRDHWHIQPGVVVAVGENCGLMYGSEMWSIVQVRTPSMPC